MAKRDADDHRHGGRHYRKWATVAAAFTGLIGVAVATVVIAGAQLASSPMATAGTTQATPWVPRPIFVPRPVPHPGTLVSAQGANGNAAANALNKWAVKATPPFQTIQKSMNDLGSAMQDGNVPAMQRACRTITTAGEKLEKTLPAPKDDLTAEVQGAVDEINAMNAACLADPPDSDGISTHGTAANNHLVNVAKLAQG